MPIIYQIDHSKGLIHTRCIGDISLADARDHLHTLQVDPGCPAQLNVLLDLSETISVPDTEYLWTISDEIALVRNIRFNACAIVSNEDHLYGMARIFAVVAKNRFAAMHVFRTFPNAEKWLDSFVLPASGNAGTAGH